MQQLEPINGRTRAERQRVEAVVETLANLPNQGETLAEVAHDARNMVTALGLYCDLLEEPGVLAAPFVHYGNELRLVAAASRRLVEKLVELNHQETAGAGAGTGAALATAPNAAPVSASDSAPDRSTDTGSWYPLPALPVSSLRSQAQSNRFWDIAPSEPIKNLAAEVTANRNLLSSLAGPATALTVDADTGALPVRLTGEDLTRVLINLVKNAAEALPGGGRILITLRERRDTGSGSTWLVLTVEDNGPGIPEQALERIFASGYSEPAAGVSAGTGRQFTHRGLGLAITRSIVEAAGGRVSASNRSQGGACLKIELPART